MDIPKQAPVIISLADEAIDQPDTTISALQSAGFSLQSQQRGIGTLAGTADPLRLDALRAVPGVAAVEQSHQFQLPRPDSKLQ